jgi:hypothetical protein
MTYEYNIIAGNPEEQSPLRRFRRNLENDTEMDPRPTGCEGVDSIHLDQDRVQWRAVVNIVINFLNP